ncbi:MAG: hybrid sensor histidine kinase/response regulator [Pseudomonadota bacterium]
MEQARLLHRYAPLTLFGASGLSIGTAVTLAIDNGWRLLGWWLAIVLALLLGRTLDHYLIGARDLVRYARRATWHAAALGVAWGAIAPLLLPDADLLTMTSLTISAVGVLAGATVCTAIWYPAFVAFTLPLSVLLAYGITQVGSDYAYLALVGLGYGGLNLLFGLGIARVQRASLRTQIENESLLGQVRTEKERAEAANRAKSRFFAAASHDLRQPVHAVQLYLDLLTEDAQQTAGLVGRIRRALGSLNEQLDGILDIAQLDAAVEAVEAAPFDAASWLRDIAERHRPQAHSQSLRLVVDAPETLGVHTDPRLLERVLDNLLSNALRYTESGSVRCTLAPNAAGVSLQVQDTGIGIAIQDQDRVFDEFYQVDNPGREREQGLGLGLAIVKRLCARLDIAMRLHSAPGAGTTVSLQLESATLQRPERTNQPDPSGTLWGWRVLLIENDALVADASRALFDSWGCETRVATNALEAEAACALGVDVAVADQRLGNDETGVAILQRLAQFACPGLLVTGDTSVETLAALKESGFPVLHKPLDAATFKAALLSVPRYSPNRAENSSGERVDQSPSRSHSNTVRAVADAE